MLTRAVFLGTGVYIALAGAVFFMVDKITLRAHPSSQSAAWLTYLTTDDVGRARIVQPPDWMAYTLVGIGGVTVLYAIAVPRPAWKKE